MLVCKLRQKEHNKLFMLVCKLRQKEHNKLAYVSVYTKANRVRYIIYIIVNIMTMTNSPASDKL